MASSNTTAAARKAKVMIVDDHPVVRRGLAELMEHEGDIEVCWQADSAAEALKLLRSCSPDLIVVDISLADISGIELIKQIKSGDESMRILVASMHDESLYAERALHAGALGYVSKHEPTDRILQAVRAVLAGRVHLSSGMTSRVLHRMVGGDEEPTLQPTDLLTDRELEVLTMLGNGMTTRQVAEKLYLSPKTIQTYREKIKKKLKLKNSAELTRYAVGWVLDTH